VDGGTGVSATQAYFGSSSGYWELANGGSPTSRVLLRAYNSAAEEKIRLDPSATSWLTGGNVGIGTTSPSAALHVAAANNGQVFIAATDANPTTIIIDTDAGSSERVRINNKDGALTFDTSNSSERARIDSSGRLLVGTSSAKANVFYTTVARTPKAQFETLTTEGVSILGTDGGAGLCLINGATSTLVDRNYGQLSFFGYDGTNYRNGASISAFSDATTGTADMPGRLVFATTADGASSPTERMRITSAGLVGIGTATPSSTLHVYKSSGNNKLELESASLANTEQASFTVTGGARSQAYGIYKHSGITNPCGYVGLTCEDAAQNFLWADNSDQLRISTNAGHIGTTSGTVVGTQTSDERVKNILGPVEYGLEILKQIEPVRYSLKSQPDIEQLGFIAQQVQPLVPQSVFDTKEHIEGEPEDAPTKLGMEYVALIPVLVNAIKELSAEVDALKAQLQAS
jgi:hypothetical protein